MARCEARSGGPGVIDPEELVIPGHELDQAAGQLLEHREVLEDVEQPLLRAHAPNDRLQRDTALLAFGIDLLPFEEVLPCRRDRPEPGFSSIRENDEAVRDKEMRNHVAVVAKVVVVGVLEVAMRRLQLDEDQGNAVDEAEQVRPTSVEIAGDPELRYEKEVVVIRRLPVNDRDPLRDLAAVRSRTETRTRSRRSS